MTVSRRRQQLSANRFHVRAQNCAARTAMEFPGRAGAWSNNLFDQYIPPPSPPASAYTAPAVKRPESRDVDAPWPVLYGTTIIESIEIAFRAVDLGDRALLTNTWFRVLTPRATVRDGRRTLSHRLTRKGETRAGRAVTKSADLHRYVKHSRPVRFRSRSYLSRRCDRQMPCTRICYIIRKKLEAWFAEFNSRK